jgi:hypothetical protein
VRWRSTHHYTSHHLTTTHFPKCGSLTLRFGRPRTAKSGLGRCAFYPPEYPADGGGAHNEVGSSGGRCVYSRAVGARAPVVVFPCGGLCSLVGAEVAPRSYYQLYRLWRASRPVASFQGCARRDSSRASWLGPAKSVRSSQVWCSRAGSDGRSV